MNSVRKRGFLPSLTRAYVSAPLQSFGDLRNRDACGLFYLNLNNRLGNYRWNIGGRNSKNIHLKITFDTYFAPWQGNKSSLGTTNVAV